MTLDPLPLIGVGMTGPDWTLPDVYGQQHTLSQSLGRSGAVLTFVRGMFCPYCADQLEQLWAGAPKFQQRGINPLVIAAHGLEALAVAATLAGTSIPVLIDSQRQVIDAYGLRHDLADFAQSGYPTGALVYPTTIVIDAAQMVRWLYIGKHYNDRPTLADVLHQIDQLQLGS